MMPPDLRPKVGDLRQVASVRRIVLDDGAERGVRALAFHAGGGLDFWALADRSLDIGPLWWRGRAVAWQNPTGFQNPGLHDREGDGGHGFGRSFSGFLVTCGLDHIRQPIDGHPLHGRLPFTPARVTAYGEDWEREMPVLFCEGEVIQARHGGEAFRLTRRIEAAIGGQALSITDTVENLAAKPWPQASLYHFNLGFPALADGTVVESRGRRLLGPLRVPDSGLLPESKSWPVDRDGPAECTVLAPQTDGARLAITFSWSAETLPHLQVWHDLRPRTCVLSIEPCTSARPEPGLRSEEPVVEAGAARRYRLDVSIDGA
jgi:hypothetical protein